MNACNTTEILIEKIKCALDVVTNVISHKVRALPNELWLRILSKLQRSSVIGHVDNIPITDFFHWNSQEYSVKKPYNGIIG